MLSLLRSGVPADQILVMVPQRTLAAPYTRAAFSPEAGAGGQVSVLTLGGLARRMVDLFWPLVAEDAGFAHPERPPAFLTLETAQYYMAHLVRPLLEEGYFESVTIDRNRLYSQVLDNLNKSAIIGFPFTDIGEKLKSAWVGEVSQVHVYENTQVCATLFRQFCLEHNLLDFSLQVQIFTQRLWPSLLCRSYLQKMHHHLIFDNLEEDTPAAHDLLREWLPSFDSSLLIYDQEAGYRRFLGADPDTAYALADLCDQHAVFTGTFVSPIPLLSFARQVGGILGRPQPDQSTPPLPPADLGSFQAALTFPDRSLRFYPEMIDWVTGQVAELVNQGTPPGEIVILAPFLPDSLRFSLSYRLERSGIPHRSHRPSRSLRDEPATGCLLTLAELAHPDWGFKPARFDLAYALIQAIEGLDLVRAQLLVDITYRLQDGVPVLHPFEAIKPDVQERITFTMGARFETLRHWLEEYRQGEPEELDYFLSRLFSEVLSQPGFGFHPGPGGIDPGQSSARLSTSLDPGQVAANLIESVQKFRWAVGETLAAEDNPGETGGGKPLGKEYIEMVTDGVIAAQYIQNWNLPPEDAVLLAPAYTFLMNNHPVDYQFWLDVGSRGWFERLYQPLTQPFVLSREWPPAKVWTDAEENEANQDGLYRLVLGLIRRCRQRVFLGLSDLNEQGFEARGALLKAIHIALRQVSVGPDE